MSEHSVAESHVHERPAHGHGDGGHHSPFQAHHFETPQQQFDAGKFGMWLFLVQEVLFFSGLFVFYAIFRVNHPDIFWWGHQALDKFYGGVNTIVLIFSSLTMAWAVRCAQKGQRTGLILTLTITLICAGIFLCVKYVEYRAKFEHGCLWAERFDLEKFEHYVAEHGHGAPHGGEGIKVEHPAEHAEGDASHAHDGAPIDLHVTPPPGISPRPTKEVGQFFSIYFAMTGLHAIHVIAGMAAITWILVRSVKGHFGPYYFGPVDYVGLYWHLVDLIWIYLFPMLYLIE